MKDIITTLSLTVWIEGKHETVSRKRRTSEPWTWNMGILRLRSISLSPVLLYTVFFVCFKKLYLEHDITYTIDTREKIWELALQASTWWWKCCVCEWCGKCSTFPMRKQTLLLYTLQKTAQRGICLQRNNILFFFLKWAPLKSYSVTINV